MSETQPAGRKLVIFSWILSVLICLLFAFSASMKLFAPPSPEMAPLGLPTHLLVPLGCLELTCVILYLIPVTSVLGVILLTGYMGGAILTHLRVGQNVVMQTLLPIFLWGALYLREPRLWALLPLRKPPRL